MRVDLESIAERINAFWGDHGYAVIAAAGLLVLVLLAVSLIKIARSAQRDRWVAGVTALVVLAWTSEGLWEVARHTLELPLGFAIMTFFVYEAMMVASALQAERHRKHHPAPGPAGRYVWLLASLTASIVALNAPTLVEALLRLSLPLAATGLWWLGITAERADDSVEIRQRRKELRQAQEARRGTALATIGFLPPSVVPSSETVHERRIRRMVAAGVRLHAARPNSRRARRANRRLCRLAMLASDHDITTVRDAVARAVYIVELILPAGPSPSTGTAGASSRSSHHRTDEDRPNFDVAVPRNGRLQPALQAEHRTLTHQGRPVNGASRDRRLPPQPGVDGFVPFPPAGSVSTAPGGPVPPVPQGVATPSSTWSKEDVARTAPEGQPRAPTQEDDQSRVWTRAHGGELSPSPPAGLASEHPPRRGRAEGSKLTAARLYQDRLRAGQRLSVSALAERAGCCRTTAWRAIRWTQSASSPAALAAGVGGVGPAWLDRPAS